MSGKTALLAEETACAKARRRQQARHLQGQARQPGWLSAVRDRAGEGVREQRGVGVGVVEQNSVETWAFYSVKWESIGRF